MNRIVTISFTPLDAGGGVPKFNRDLHSAFPDRQRVHYSWWDFPWWIEMERMPEWEKARTLNHFLVQSRAVLPSDVIIADGFWATGLETFPLAVSHSHGIWDHRPKADEDAGLPGENTLLHTWQRFFRERWTNRKKPFTAVSDFIAEQMRLRWGFQVDRVINNGVDTSIFIPTTSRFPRKRPILIHGVNDRGNLNKGWDHIQLLIDRSHTDPEMNVEVLSLDEMAERYGGPKEWALSQADLFVHPSGYEGNSMMVAEAMSCGLPIVGYDVGYLWKVQDVLGLNVLRRDGRSPDSTLRCVKDVLQAPDLFKHMGEISRDLAVRDLSIERFRGDWREYVKEIEG